MIEPINIRASSTPRFMQCAGSAFLPHVQSGGAPAKLGTVAHLAAAEIVRGGIPDVESLAKLHDVNEDELQSLTYSARAMWEGMKEHFPEPKTEVTFPAMQIGGVRKNATLSGTADVISDTGKELRVADWKSGWRESNHGAQLKSYALLAMTKAQSDESREFDVERVYVAVFWMRNREVEAQWYSREELEQWHQMLCSQLDKGATGELVIGEGCTYCPVADCPAFRTQLAMWRDESSDLAITAENVVALHHLRSAIESRCKVVKDAVAHFVEQNGAIPIGDGRELTMTERATSEIVTDKAWPLLTERFGEDQAMEIVKLSKSSIEELVKNNAEKGMKGKEVKAFIEELETAGAIEKSASRFPAIKKITGEL